MTPVIELNHQGRNLQNTHIRLLDKVSKKQMAVIPIKELEKDGDLFFFQSRYLVNSKEIRWKLRWGLAIPFGVIRYMDLCLPNKGVVQNTFWKIVLPTLAFLKKRNTIVYRKLSRQFIWEEFTPGEGTQPIELTENFLQGQEGSLEYKRITYLLENILEFVEARDNGQSKLYKDKKDGRFWQTIDGKDGLFKLYQVNFAQWQHYYVESKERPDLKPTQEDEEYYHSLEENPEMLKCTLDDCKARAITYSSLCRDHHFEAIKGHPFQK